MLLPQPAPILKRLQNTKRGVRARPVELLCSSEQTGCSVSPPLLVVVNYATGIEGHGWVLAKTSPVTYKIQRHARTKPEIVHVEKLLPYQADFGGTP